MKIVPSSKIPHYMVEAVIFSIAIVIIAGMAGCGDDGNDNPPPQEGEIYTWYDLDDVRDNLGGSYTLMNDLDSTTPGYTELASPTANGGKGWEPIGGWEYGGFIGTFDGQGYEIRDLFINRPDEDHVGLFGYASAFAADEVLKDIGVVDATVTGKERVGILAGDSDNTLRNCYSSGTVTGYEYIGGLVGYIDSGVFNSYSNSSVTGNSSVGGLVGCNVGVVRDSCSGSNVTGNDKVGGLVGFNESYLHNSYATGNVTGSCYVGGLVGCYFGSGIEVYIDIVSDSYATGNVNGDEYVGGLVGWNYYGTVSNSYCTGSVSGDSSVGGLVGENEAEGVVTNSFWDTETSGQSTSDGGTGKNTTEMKDIITFFDADWNIITVSLNETNPDYIWNIVSSVTYPFLGWQS